MAKRQRGTGPLSPAYERRLDRADAIGVSRSQARGHARSTERTITSIKREAKQSGRSVRDIPILRDVINTFEKMTKGTTYVEITGTPTREQIEQIIRQKESEGYNLARIIRGKSGASKTTGWFDIEDFDTVDDLSEDADAYSGEGYSGVYSIAFGRG